MSKNTITRIMMYVVMIYLSLIFECLRLVSNPKHTMHRWFTDHTWTLTEWLADTKGYPLIDNPAYMVGHVHDDVELGPDDARRF